MKTCAALLLVALMHTRAFAGEPPQAIATQITVYMTGEVHQRGRCILPAGATVFDAIIAAGDMTEDGSFRHVRLTRRMGEGMAGVGMNVNVYEELTDPLKATILCDGDTLSVPFWGISRGF